METQDQSSARLRERHKRVHAQVKATEPEELLHLAESALNRMKPSQKREACKMPLIDLAECELIYREIFGAGGRWARSVPPEFDFR